ncbi:MAG: heparan-alpha-glucosaminide N-acetyltransferase [Rhizobiaceae bacterium]|nr:heparan-alpha-glucosaminide N-acetyltransferase [Rhizobiaceae bacterium]
MKSVSQRVEFLDFARGGALIAMTVFHFAFDLELFGFQERGFINQAHWKYFARAIASSFLILTGFSLFLAHVGGISWPKWQKRLAMIGGAAILITIATYFATPDQYIFFGILHQITFASVAGLVFLQLPWFITFAIAMGIFWIGQTTHLSMFDPQWLWWTGLSEVTPTSSDFVPVFPWFSAPLIGIALAKLCDERGWLAQLAKPQFDSRIGRGLKFLGRHSLVYYLLHQPIMIGFILAYSLATGALVL